MLYFIDTSESLENFFKTEKFWCTQIVRTHIVRKEMIVEFKDIKSKNNLITSRGKKTKNKDN